jgi:hypothetical protein
MALKDDKYKSPLFHQAHYNIIAARIRETMPIDLAPNTPQYDKIREHNMVSRAALTDLALSLAHRFKEDNPNFRPLSFLDACSPNTDVYPLSELWED